MAETKECFTPLTSEWDAEAGSTNRVREGRVEVEDNETDFPMIRLGVSSDTGGEAHGYVREYAVLTPTEARRVAAALNRAARVAAAYIRETGWKPEDA